MSAGAVVNGYLLSLVRRILHDLGRVEQPRQGIGRQPQQRRKHDRQTQSQGEHMTHHVLCGFLGVVQEAEQSELEAESTDHGC